MKNRSFLTTTINGCAVLAVVCLSYGSLYLVLLRPVSTPWPMMSFVPSHTVFQPDYVGTTSSRFLNATIRSVFEPAYRIDRQIRPEFWRRPIDWIPVVDGRDFLSPQSVKMLESYVARQNQLRDETREPDLKN